MIFCGAGLTANGLEPSPADSIGSSGFFSPGAHMALAVLVALLSLAIAGWITARGGANRPIGIVLFLLVLAEGGLGSSSLNPAMKPWIPVFHATLAPLFLAALASAALVVSPGWQTESGTVKDGGWPSLRSMAILTPVLVVIQIFFGAAFRHEAMGIMSHIAGAILTALLILLAGMFVNQQCSEHKPLKRGAVMLMSVAFTQVGLGMAAISIRMMTSTNTTPVILLTGAHVMIGSLTLAANVVLSLEIRRWVTPKA